MGLVKLRRPRGRAATIRLIVGALVLFVVLIVLRALWWGRWEYAAEPLFALGSFVLLAEVAALGGMVLVRRSIAVAALEAHRETAGFVYTTLGAAYAVLLSFLVVVSWTEYHDAAQTVTNEALAAATLFHLADGLDDATRRDVQQALIDYNRTVLDDEWPAMARGAESARAWQLSDHLWDVYMHAPAESQGRPAYTQSLVQMQQFYALRGRRLLDSRSALPSPVWVVLSIGAAITVGFTYLFGVRRLLSQIVITAALTAIMAGSLYLVIDFDTLYSGPLQLDRAPFQANLDFFAERPPP